jgi:TolB protein
MKTALCWLGCLLASASLQAQVPAKLESQLILLEIATGKETLLLRQARHLEAPNWSRDGQYLIVNSNGLLEKIWLNGATGGIIPTGFANACNNDHGLSFDDKWLVISHNDTTVAPGNNSRIFVMPIAGGTPRLVTPLFPSYWHGISPDGNLLVYCAQRKGEWDVYRISVEGGPEMRLTKAPGLDDGPEYSYDGQWIYFNSHRTGRMHIYRMHPDGTGQQQLTQDTYDNWFPHPSPDNQFVAYISYLEDQKGQHPFGKQVKLRIMDLKTFQTRDLSPVFYGGQGSFNVPSWSPDGKYLAYIRYKAL